MALGGDQGGSIRTPPAGAAINGLKPTWGLVPMTGGMPISYSVDHCGPICGSTEDVARLLTAIAGPDGYDPRTIVAKVQDYMGALARGRQRNENCADERGLRPSDKRSGHRRKVRAAIAEFKALGRDCRRGLRADAL